MFTGIIEEIGVVKRISRQGQGMILSIEASKILEDVQLGDSIAVNGVCLTVVAFDSSSITVDVMPETFRQTGLSGLKPGDRVNLERAMSPRGRFGGHIVQGHVDTTAVIRSRETEDNAVVFRAEPRDKDVLRYIVPRGSVAVDGISLTVVRVSEHDFAVSIIPHTMAQTVLKDKHPGDTVNVECDILGKYVERMLAIRFGDQPPGSGRKAEITESFLAEHGFM